MRTIPSVFTSVALITTLASAAAAGEWGAPKSPVIPEASGYVEIPHAAVMPDPGHVYKAIYDANHAADKPTQLVPALDMAGSELNLFGATGVPMKNVKFVVVFHGPAMDGLLDDAHYRAKYKVANPNLKAMARMRKLGVEFFVCGQNLAAVDFSRKSLTPDVKVALDALVVLMAYQDKGYALLSF